MRTFSLLGAAVLCTVAAANTLRTRYAVKETHLVPPQFTRESDAPADHPIRLSLGLRQSRFDELERHLYEIADPDHARYGQHLSAADVHALVRPSDDSLAHVTSWLRSHGVDPDRDIDFSPARDYLTFTLPVAKIETLLDTKYGVYRHSEDGSALVRTPAWSLPLHLHEHVDSIQPTTAFTRARPQGKLVVGKPVEPADLDDVQSVDVNAKAGPPTVASVCNTGGVTPLCLRTLYGTVNYKAQVPGKNQIGLTDYLGEINNRSDTKIYLQKYRPDAVAAANKFKQVSINGGTTQQTPETPAQVKAGVGLEGNLDVETVLGIGYPTPLTAYSTGGKPPFQPDAEEATDDNEPYMTWLNYVLKQDFVPQVISNSYEDNEQTVPKSYAVAVCKQFAQLGARGVSVLFGSGDGGVSGVQTSNVCESNVNNETAFIPVFPSTCPYITSVGATVNFNPEAVAYDPANGFVSGGGFSNYFSRPSYQSKAVESYLPSINPSYSHLYNSSGRAYPDIAAYGVNFTIIWDGKLVHLDGTSASTPTAAAVLTLLNDALLAAGKPVLGFLNPWLYKKGHEAFVDVTKGNTMGCNTTGYPAVKGWDAASGWGTPRFAKLLQAVGLETPHGYSSSS